MRPRLPLACLTSTCLLLLQAFPASAQGATWLSFCASEPAGASTEVYITPVFDSHIPWKTGYRSPVMAREYEEYIKGKFGYRPGITNVATCTSYQTADQAESGKAVIAKMATDVQHRVISVEWNYQPDPSELAFAATYVREAGTSPPALRGQMTSGYCVADQIDVPLYYAGVFDAGAEGVNLAQWQIAYNRFLGAKYGTRGFPFCSSGTRLGAERMLAARQAGAKSAGRKLVDTGWRPGAAAPAAAVSTPAPAQMPGAAPQATAAASASAPAPANLKETATREGNEALALCNEDRMMSGPYDCYAIQRAVYNYRMAHAAAPTGPIAQIIDHTDCGGCTTESRMQLWASNRAQSNGFSFDKSQCVGKKFSVSLLATPNPNRVKEFFEAAMKACPR